MDESSYPDLAVIDEKSLGRNSWKVIGAGGFGQVYKARHRQWKSDVAVKLIGFDDGSDSEKSLLHEAKLMQQAACPHVIKVLAVFKGRLPSAPFIHIGLVMELMERGSLASLQKKLNHSPLPWPLGFQLAHQVALGMNYLHSLDPPIIHKDLKPDNILLDEDLNGKITDFGLSKFDKCSTSSRIKGAGTTSYMPPEALESYKATPAFDVYSYGILLCSIMKGGNPYGQDVRTILEMQVCFGKRPSLEEVDPEQATGLEDLVELAKRCWDQEPDKRPLFSECTAVTEALLEKHQPGIKDAVHQVVTELFPPPAVQDKRESDDNDSSSDSEDSEDSDHHDAALESGEEEEQELKEQQEQRVRAENLRKLNAKMPAGWQAHRNSEGRIYFVDHSTKTTTWDDPRLVDHNDQPDLGTMPNGWEKRVDPHGKTYYVDHNTRTTHWLDPRLQNSAESGEEEEQRVRAENLLKHDNDSSSDSEESEDSEDSDHSPPPSLQDKQESGQRNLTQEVKGAVDELMSVRSEFIRRVPRPILNELLEELLDKRVISGEEKDAANDMQSMTKKARFVVDMVLSKGNKASSVMIDILDQLD